MATLRLFPWVIVLAVFAFPSGGCTTNPYTKRWQLLMIPQSYETKLGAQAYQDVLSDPKVKESQGCGRVRSGRTGR